MLPLLPIACALACALLPDAAYANAIAGPAWIPLLLPLPHALAVWHRRAALRGRFRAASASWSALRFLALVLHAIALFALGWMSAVDAWLALGPWSMPPQEWRALLGLAPFAAFECLAIDARARVLSATSAERTGLRRFHARALFSVLALLTIVFGSLGAANLSSALRAQFDQVVLVQAALAIAGGLLTLSLLPPLLVRTLGAEPMRAGAERELVDAVARHAGFASRGTRVLDTRLRMANAALIGAWPKLRYIVLTDLLVAQLGPRELAAVYAHEIGHARCRHVASQIALSAGLLFGGYLVIASLPIASELVQLALIAGLVLVWRQAFGYLSRRCELEADLESVAIVGDARALERAFERLGGLHARPERDSWRHFRSGARISFLRASARDPGAAERLRRELRSWRRAAAVLGVLALAAGLVLATRRWSEDQVRAALQRGDYVAAAERSAAPDTDADLASFALAARELERAQGEPATVERLELWAAQALQAGRLETARFCFDLLAWRGDPRARARADELRGAPQ
jgi:Zn-dependent protease with chaperone function